MINALFTQAPIVCLSFWSGLLVADIVTEITVEEVVPSPYVMASLSFGVAMVMGALQQYELKSNEGYTCSKGTFFCACVFSGIAGFIVFAMSRTVITDPLLIVVQAILAGLVGAPLVRKLAKEFADKFQP